MKKHSQAVVIQFALLAFLILVSLAMPQNATAQSNQPDKVTVLFILDDSGSMAGNDPNNLRYTAAKLFIASLDDGDAVGAIRFSTQSQPLTDPMLTIGSPSSKNDMINLLQPVKGEGFTDVKRAFTDAEGLLKDAGISNKKTIVIFLTDGKPEIQKPYTGYEDETLSVAKELGVPVYAIALTYGGQSAFLNRVASQTGGKVISAKSANDLLDSYLQILGDLKDRTVIGEGMSHSPGDIAIKLEPALMPYVNKATFIVSQDAGVSVKLIGPDQKEIQPSNTMVSFSMVTDRGFKVYSITNPASGEWVFQLSGSGNVQARAILHSRLRTKIVSPAGMIEAGEPMPVVVNLIEQQADGSMIKIIGDTSFSALVTLPDGAQQSLDMFYDDGTHGDTLAGDGSYTREFVDTTQSGTYGIDVRGIKGVIPVSTSTQVEVIPFPTLVVDQPGTYKYEIRSNTVPLQVHLVGLSKQDDFEGSIIASVTSPDGHTTDIPLNRDNENYTGAFAPAESGKYSITYRSRNAYYQGLPFLKEIKTDFGAVFFSQATLESVKLGLDGSPSHEKFEMQQAAQGIPLVITIKSTAPEMEEIIPKIENLPGFTLAEGEPVPIAPNGKTNITLHLVGDVQVNPGKWDGNLVLYPQGMVDILNNRAPISFELFTPQVSVSTEVISTCEQGKCWQWAPVKVILRTESKSLILERIDLQLEGLDDGNLSQKSIEVQPGGGQTELEIKSAKPFAPGNYDATITLSPERKEVVLLTNQPMQIFFVVKPAWMSCQKPLIILGVVIVAVGIIIRKVIGSVKAKVKKPIVTGTIKYEPVKPEQLYDEFGNPIGEIATVPDGPESPRDGINLTEKGRIEILIGSDPTCEVIIPDSSIEAKHARIIAEKEEGRVILYLFPMATVYKIKDEYGNREEIVSKCELKHKDIFILGNIQIKYLGHGIN